MKPGNLLIAALLSVAPFCPAQESQPTAPEAAKAAAQETAAPVTKETAAATTPEAAKASAADNYVIGTTDALTLFVWKEPDLSVKDLLVRPDGMISIPLLGDVKASGKTPLQLAAEITTEFKKYIQDPNVTVTVNGMNSKRVYLIGEVGHVGPIGLMPGMTVLEAIATAGGLTPYANTKKMYILRGEAGKQEKIPVQYKQALKGDSSLNLTLNSGDTIVVP